MKFSSIGKVNNFEANVLFCFVLFPMGNVFLCSSLWVKHCHIYFSLVIAIGIMLFVMQKVFLVQ